MKAVGIGVDDTRPHTAGCALATHDQALNAQDREVREQRRALERARALLPDHHVRRLRRELVIDRIAIGPGSRALVARRYGALRSIVWSRLLRAVENRDAGAPSSRKQLFGRLDRPVREHPARVGVLIVELDRWSGAAAIDEVIEIDRQ